MTEYTLYFAQTAGTQVTVDAESLEEAVDLAYNELPGGVCAQCAGWGREGRPGIDLSGDWELDEKATREDYPNE